MHYFNRHCQIAVPSWSLVRDDVHRRAPVPPRWRALLRAHRNEASSRSDGDAAAVRVMERELRVGFPSSFRTELAKATKHRQVTLTATRDLEESARGAPLAQRLAAELAMRRPTGGIAGAHVEEAACTAARSLAAAYLRELDGYLALEAPRERRAAMVRMRSSLRKVDVAGLGRAVANGEKISVTRFSRKRLDSEEDVR
jgi:hypothetical protein